MNTVISQTTNAHLWPLAHSLQSLVTARGGPANCERFELEDAVLRAGGFAWDIGVEAAAPLHAEIARMTEEKEAADATAAAEAAALAAAQPWRVSKDTIIMRVVAADALAAVMAALSTQSAEQQFVWNHSAWFWSNNETLRGLCVVLGLDPDVILARDNYL